MSKKFEEQLIRNHELNLNFDVPFSCENIDKENVNTTMNFLNIHDSITSISIENLNLFWKKEFKHVKNVTVTEIVPFEKLTKFLAKNNGIKELILCSDLSYDDMVMENIDIEFLSVLSKLERFEIMNIFEYMVHIGIFIESWKPEDAKLITEYISIIMKKISHFELNVFSSSYLKLHTFEKLNSIAIRSSNADLMKLVPERLEYLYLFLRPNNSKMIEEVLSSGKFKNIKLLQLYFEAYFEFHLSDQLLDSIRHFIWINKEGYVNFDFIKKMKNLRQLIIHNFRYKDIPLLFELKVNFIEIYAEVQDKDANWEKMEIYDNFIYSKFDTKLTRYGIETNNFKLFEDFDLNFSYCYNYF